MEKHKILAGALKAAIERGLAPNGDLVRELQPFEKNYHVESIEDAQAICRALGAAPRVDPGAVTSPAFALVSLFQTVESRRSPAYAVLHAEGQKRLIALFDSMIGHAADVRSGNLLFLIMKILATYETHEGAARVVQAARLPLEPTDFLWKAILRPFGDDHPEAEFVFAQLRDPLPPGFIGVSLMESAAAAGIGGHLRGSHPFDTVSGKQQLRLWLQSTDAAKYSYAHSAAASLPFISNPERDELLRLAMGHADARVQIEGGWAAATVGQEAGLELLTRYSTDPEYAGAAQRYLAELRRKEHPLEKTHSEAAINQESLSSIHKCALDAAKLLGLESADEDPKAAVTMVDQYVYDWQRNKLPESERLGEEDVPYILGSLWGELLVQKLGWHWAMVTFHEYGDTVAAGVISEDCSLAIYPFNFITGCLRDPGVDVTIALSFNMLIAGRIPPLDPGRYYNLMDGVHRIVPR